MFCRKTTKGWLRGSIDADHNSRVLDRAARVQQPSSHGADFCPLNMLSHDRQPLGVDYFDVVVHEKKPWAVGLLGCEIFGRGIIRRA